MVFLKPLFETCLCFKSEFFFGQGRVYHSSWLTIRFCAVPANLSFKIHDLADCFNQVFYFYFPISAYVYRFGLIIFSVAKTIPSAQSSAYRNSLEAFPVPQTSIYFCPAFGRRPPF